MRTDGRQSDELRPLRFTPGFIPCAAGSCLVEAGRTRVICTASVDTDLPKWLDKSGRGWLSAEYSMLPASTGKRKMRDGRKSVQTDGRSVEIQRLIGRVLRAGVDLGAMPGFSITIDCDVIEADGGTRTAAINGAWVALELAVRQLLRTGGLKTTPLLNPVAAVSVVCSGELLLLDPCATEDQAADADLNVALTSEGRVVDIQGTAERGTLSRELFDAALLLAQSGITSIHAQRRSVLA
ncbi:MAG: ribonuclease PH [Planctomycetes bacterium]|nr:ribonuclease PH [Planctomycetota bacterium]